jgi:branched-subunit amino acid transport protein
VRPGLLLTFLGMGVATYLTRAPLLFLLARRRLPPWLERYFAALPIALLTALAVPLVLVQGGRLVGPWAPEVPATLVVILLARRTGNLLLAVGAGVVLVAGLRSLGG